MTEAIPMQGAEHLNHPDQDAKHPNQDTNIAVDDLLSELRDTLGRQAIDLAVAKVRISQLEKQLAGGVNG